MDDDALRDWLSCAPTIPLRTDTQRLDRVIAGMPHRGYLVERLTPGGRRLYARWRECRASCRTNFARVAGELISDIGERVYLRSEAEARQRHDISVISAPVYDHHRSDHGGVPADRLGYDRLRDRKARKGLTATADALTTGLGGSKPQW